MLKFDEKELDYIKTQMEDILDAWDNGTKEELKQYIDSIGGEQLDTVLLFSRNNWLFFTMENINYTEYYNKLIISFCWNALGLWVWREADFTIAEEVEKYCSDKIICKLFEKIYEYFVEQDK